MHLDQRVLGRLAHQRVARAQDALHHRAVAEDVTPVGQHQLRRRVELEVLARAPPHARRALAPLDRLRLRRRLFFLVLVLPVVVAPPLLGLAPLHPLAVLLRKSRGPRRLAPRALRALRLCLLLLLRRRRAGLLRRRLGLRLGVPRHQILLVVLLLGLRRRALGLVVAIRDALVHALGLRLCQCAALLVFGGLRLGLCHLLRIPHHLQKTRAQRRPLAHLAAAAAAAAAALGLGLGLLVRTRLPARAATQVGLLRLGLHLGSALHALAPLEEPLLERHCRLAAAAAANLLDLHAVVVAVAVLLLLLLHGLLLRLGEEALGELAHASALNLRVGHRALLNHHVVALVRVVLLNHHIVVRRLRLRLRRLLLLDDDIVIGGLVSSGCVDGVVVAHLDDARLVVVVVAVRLGLRLRRLRGRSLGGLLCRRLGLLLLLLGRLLGGLAAPLLVGLLRGLLGDRLAHARRALLRAEAHGLGDKVALPQLLGALCLLLLELLERLKLGANLARVGVLFGRPEQVVLCLGQVAHPHPRLAAPVKRLHVPFVRLERLVALVNGQREVGSRRVLFELLLELLASRVRRLRAGGVHLEVAGGHVDVRRRLAVVDRLTHRVLLAVGHLRLAYLAGHRRVFDGLLVPVHGLLVLAQLEELVALRAPLLLRHHLLVHLHGVVGLEPVHIHQLELHLDRKVLPLLDEPRLRLGGHERVRAVREACGRAHPRLAAFAHLLHGLVDARQHALGLGALHKLEQPRVVIRVTGLTGRALRLDHLALGPQQTPEPRAVPAGEALAHLAHGLAPAAHRLVLERAHRVAHAAGRLLVRPPLIRGVALDAHLDLAVAVGAGEELDVCVQRHPDDHVVARVAADERLLAAHLRRLSGSHLREHQLDDAVDVRAVAEQAHGGALALGHVAQHDDVVGLVVVHLARAPVAHLERARALVALLGRILPLPSHLEPLDGGAVLVGRDVFDEDKLLELDLDLERRAGRHAPQWLALRAEAERRRDREDRLLAFAHAAPTRGVVLVAHENGLPPLGEVGVGERKGLRARGLEDLAARHDLAAPAHRHLARRVGDRRELGHPQRLLDHGPHGEVAHLVHLEQMDLILEVGVGRDGLAVASRRAPRPAVRHARVDRDQRLLALPHRLHRLLEGAQIEVARADGGVQRVGLGALVKDLADRADHRHQRPAMRRDRQRTHRRPARAVDRRADAPDVGHLDLEAVDGVLKALGRRGAQQALEDVARPLGDVGERPLLALAHHVLHGVRRLVVALLLFPPVEAALRRRHVLVVAPVEDLLVLLLGDDGEVRRLTLARLGLLVLLRLLVLRRRGVVARRVVRAAGQAAARAVREHRRLQEGDLVLVDHADLLEGAAQMLQRRHRPQQRDRLDAVLCERPAVLFQAELNEERLELIVGALHLPLCHSERAGIVRRLAASGRRGDLTRGVEAAHCGLWAAFRYPKPRSAGRLSGRRLLSAGQVCGNQFEN